MTTLLRTLFIGIAGGYLALTFTSIRSSNLRADDTIYSFLFREGAFEAEVTDVESRHTVFHFWKIYNVKENEEEKAYRVTIPLYGNSRIVVASEE